MLKAASRRVACGLMGLSRNAWAGGSRKDCRRRFKRNSGGCTTSPHLRTTREDQHEAGVGTGTPDRPRLASNSGLQLYLAVHWVQETHRETAGVGRDL